MPTSELEFGVAKRRAIVTFVVACSAILITSLAPAPAHATRTGDSVAPLIERTVEVNGQLRTFWVYVPTDYAEYRLDDPKDAPIITVVPPDGASGDAFARESAWTQVAERQGFVAVFPNAGDEGWRTRGSGVLEDADFVSAATIAVRSEWKGGDLNTYLVGEGSGAAVANVAAVRAPQQYVATASLDGAGSTQDLEAANVAPVGSRTPSWQISVGSKLDRAEQAQVDYWKTQNATDRSTRDREHRLTGSSVTYYSSKDRLSQVRVSSVKRSSDLRGTRIITAIYESFFHPVMRFADRTSTNGTLTAYRSIRELGLTEHVTVVDGQEHRWLAYVPRRFRSGRHAAKLPLVVAFHGRNGSARYLAQQTQWADVAEARGLVLVFPHYGAPVGTEPTANVGWATSISADNPDVPVALGIIDDTVRRYRIDTTRISITGVSQGAAFTNRLAVQYPERFASIAPCYSGHLSASSYQDLAVVRRDVPLPTWQCRGADELPTQFPGGTAGETAARTFWRETVNKNVGPATTQVDGRHTTEIFSDGLAEYRWTVNDDIGHFIPRNLSFKLWDEMMSRYARNADGVLVKRG